jgi:holo-[acyl-carrier protein] synthase
MIGIDIVDISRIQLRDSFIRHVLTEYEQNEYNAKTTENRKKEYLAGRFAAKEAIFKATQDPAYLQYSILNKKNGMPYVKDHPEILVSISHDGGIAAAIVQIQ